MDIVSIDGKDYLNTYIAKINNNSVDASGFFIDIRECVNAILKKFNNKYKLACSYLDSNTYGGNLQSMLNRFSGDYFSPSFLKNYETNPALCLFNSLFTEDVNDAAAIGTTFHKIMEEYYKLPKEERQREKIWQILDKEILEGQDRERLSEFIEGFIVSGDYLGGKMDDTKLDCQTERRGRLKIHVKSHNYTLPCFTAYVADRIDFRDNGIYIIDYKTGKPKASVVTFDGYLGSMIIYKWAVEQELDVKVNSAYLMTPGNKKKFMELDFSKENELKMIEKIERFYRRFTKDNQRRVYEFTNEGYFNSNDAAAFRYTMNDNTIWMAKIPVQIYIGLTKERLL